MKKITMYELLGMIKDGKAPKKIIYRDNLFEYKASFEDYRPDDVMKYHGNHLFHYLFEEEVMFLNDEVEILEEENKMSKKIIIPKLIPTSLKGIDDLDEKIEIAHIDTINVIEVVNQIIDYLKSKGE